MSDVLLITDENHVRTLTLNRPDTMNAMSPELAWGVISALEAAAKDDDVWIIGITGNGRGFCSGLDLTGRGGAAPDYQGPRAAYLDDISWVGRMPLIIRERCDKPVIAGLNGVAVGAGLSLALAADIRIMSSSARILAGYPRIGGSPDGGMTWTLPQLIGYEQAMRFLLENKTVEASEALRLGIVSEVVEADQFQQRFHDYCQSLTNISPITAWMTKRTLAKGQQTIDLEAQMRLEIASIGRCFASEDGKEARTAFMEKRAPVFQGR